MTNGIEMESVSTAIVDAIGKKEAVDPTTLPLLADGIDTEALNDLFTKSYREPSASQVHVTFQYYGYEGTVQSGGEVALKPINEIGVDRLDQLPRHSVRFLRRTSSDALNDSWTVLVPSGSFERPSASGDAHRKPRNEEAQMTEPTPVLHHSIPGFSGSE